MSKSTTVLDRIKSFFDEIGDMTFFAARFFRELFSAPFEIRELLRQCYNVGNRSLFLVLVTGFILGLVFTLQSRPTLMEFGAESWMASMVSLSIVREIGPVIIALICAGKIGSGMGAELGSMKVSEQIDAMEVSSTRPIRFLVVTRVLAATLMIPILVLYADALGILGSWAGTNLKGSVSFVLFFSQAFASVSFSDFLPAIVKTFFFGAAIGLVGCYQGYNTGRGTASVGVAANTAVVIASFL